MEPSDLRLVRVTFNCADTYGVQLVDEHARRLLPLASNLSLRDLRDIGVDRIDVERMGTGDAIDLSLVGQCARDGLSRLALREVLELCNRARLVLPEGHAWSEETRAVLEAAAVAVEVR